MSEQLKPDSGKAWRQQRDEGEVGVLPSGRVVRGRTVLPVHILQQGADVPDILTALALKLFWGKATYPEVVAFREERENAEDALKVSESLKIVVRAFLLEPRVVDEPLADDEISIDHVLPQDQAYIWDVAFMEATALAEFFRASREQASHLQDVAEGNAVPLSAK